MVKGRTSDVDVWFARETPRIREALESASRYFDSSDSLTVNTLEAVYGQESSFGTILGTRGSASAAGHFQFIPETAKRYGLSVSKHNDQRFDIDYAASAAARYLKDLDTMFSKRTTLSRQRETITVASASERKQFVLGAFNAGEGRIARAQRLAAQAGKDPQLWSDVAAYLAEETRRYVETVPRDELEFAQKSPADNSRKENGVRNGQYRCTEGHWVTIDERPVFICD